ncbi:MAG: hypothetical protein ACK5RO_01830 [Pseudobdellovibrionaceae bacterium]
MFLILIAMHANAQVVSVNKESQLIQSGGVHPACLKLGQAIPSILRDKL